MKFVRNFLLYIPVKLMPACSTVILIVYLYRVLPEGHYTNYSIALACSLMVVQLGTSWIGNSFVYFYSLTADKHALLANSLRLLFIVAPLVVLAAAALAGAFGVTGAFWLILFLGVTQAFYLFFSSVLQARFLIWNQLWVTCLQVGFQFSVLLFVFTYLNTSYRGALLALAVGYSAGILYAVNRLRPVLVKSFVKESFKEDVAQFYRYGIALVPWMLGVLVLASADKILVGYFRFELSDSYISTKDLFVGASGLISMPLLMLVHPIIINSFNIGKRFDYRLINESLRYLIICFAMLWIFLHTLGFELFFFLTSKKLVVTTNVLFFSYLSVFFSCASIYLQKRYEVHRKWPLLACFSLISAGLCVAFIAVGSLWFGILGASIAGAMGQLIYFVLVARSLLKKISFNRSWWVLFLCLCGAYAVLFQAKSFFQAFIGLSPNWLGISLWVALFVFFASGFMIFLVRWSLFNNGAN